MASWLRRRCSEPTALLSGRSAFVALRDVHLGGEIVLPPSCVARRPAASSGARPATPAPARWGKGATSTSPRSCSIAETTASATSSGERVPTPAGARRRSRRTCPASRMKPGNTPRRPRRCRAGPSASPPRSRAGRTWWRCRGRTPGAVVLPAIEEMKSSWPRRRSSIPGSRAWASRIGARRLTSSARSICSIEKDSRRPLAGQRGVGHEDVHLSRLGDQARDLRALARGRPPSPSRRARSASGRAGRRASTGEGQLGAAGAQRARDRVTDAPRGAGEQHRGALDLHEL